MMIMKVCNKCGLSKSLSEFYKDSQKKDGHSYSCKKCSYDYKNVEVNRKKKRECLELEYIGKKFGFWTVNSVFDKGQPHIFYNCKCVCGTERVIRKTVLRNNQTKSCGCNGNFFVGKRFGMMTVISDVFRKKDGRIYVKALCDCGTEKIVLKQSLESTLTTSCGCYNKFILRSMTGEKHHNYKPELTEEERIANNSRGSNPRYQSFRRSVLKRDGNKCVICDFHREKDMRVHHVYSWNTHTELRYEIGNAVTLCPRCHDIQYEGSFHNIYKNGNNTKQQFEEFRNNRKVNNN